MGFNILIMRIFSLFNKYLNIYQYFGFLNFYMVPSFATYKRIHAPNLLVGDSKHVSDRMHLVMIGNALPSTL
jgi:hypothetical protein